MKLNRSKIGVKWKIFFYVAGFALAMIVLLWLFQVVFLDTFYRSVKTQQIKDTTHEIVDNISDKNLDKFIDSMSNNSDYCIRIFDANTLMPVFGNTQNKGLCGFLITNEDEIYNLYEEAKAQDGTVLKTTRSIAFENRIKDFNERYEMTLPEDKKFSDDFEKQIAINAAEEMQSMTYGVISEKNNTSLFILVNSRITLMSEISETIRMQLMMITIILLIFSIILAFLIASRISKPIIKTNESAKHLAEGKFDVVFEGKGYLEIEELNDTLNYASVELSKVEKLRNELIANMSHDLRTPLTMIAGYGEVMRDLPGENTPKNVQVIIDECNRLTKLVNDILDLSKLQSGTQSLTLARFNITQMLIDTTQRLSTLLKKDGFQITMEYDQEVFVEADQIKMSQVVYNLLVNAIHYSNENKTIIVRQIVEKNRVRIEVVDHGEGIAKENLPYVWDRYYKIDKVHKRAQIGSGLGLSIVKGVLELHKATYGVSSQINKGTTFYFELDIIDQ